MSEQHDKMIAVIKGHAEGKKVRCRTRGCSEWCSVNEPRWNFDASDYELVPEPVPPGDLTWEEAKELQQEGLPLEVKFWPGNGWQTLSMKLSELNDGGRKYAYRRKPAPRRATLEPQDVKPGDVVRPAGYKVWRLVLAVWETGFSIVEAGDLSMIKWTTAKENGWEISHDGGKTWSKCEKEETK